jgi:hypothetical protein
MPRDTASTKEQWFGVYSQGKRRERIVLLIVQWQRVQSCSQSFSELQKPQTKGAQVTRGLGSSTHQQAASEASHWFSSLRRMDVES